jgi:hypothetical protein
MRVFDDPMPAQMNFLTAIWQRSFQKFHDIPGIMRILAQFGP